MKSDQHTEGPPCNQEETTADHHDGITSNGQDGFQQEAVRPKLLVTTVILRIEGGPLEQGRDGPTIREYEITLLQAYINYPEEVRQMLDDMAAELDGKTTTQLKGQHYEY